MKLQSAASSGTLIAEGTTVLTLKSCELKRVTSKFVKDGDGKEEKVLWLFQSDPYADGNTYEYLVWTKLIYGDEKAKLTGLLDMMIPGMTMARSQTLDTNELIGKRYRTRIVHKTSELGKTYANHVFLELSDGQNDHVAESNGRITPQNASNISASRQEVDATW